MKLSEYAKQNSITYKTAFNHWKKGYIKGKQLPSGTIVVFDEQGVSKLDISNKDISVIVSEFTKLYKHLGETIKRLKAK